MQSKFRIGHPVCLAAGGPTMTVSAYTSGEQLLCVWFTRDGEIRKDVFSEATLVEVNDVKPWDGKLDGR